MVEGYPLYQLNNIIELSNILSNVITILWSDNILGCTLDAPLVVLLIYNESFLA